MKTPVIIELHPIELRKQRPTEVIACKLILHENVLEYILDFYADETETDDEELQKTDEAWENVYNNFHIIAGKDRIGGYEKSYQSKSDVWLVAIYVRGFDGPIRLYFEDDEKATEMTQHLGNYLYGLYASANME